MSTAETDLYQRARARVDSKSGFYNHNIVLDTGSGPVVVRIPIPGAEVMDLRIWPESEVLSTVANHLDNVPAVRFVSRSPAFQVHEFVRGRLLDDTAPRGVRVGNGVLAAVVDLFGHLRTVSRTELPPLPAGWPPDGDSTGFANRLSAVTAGVHARCRPEFGVLFRDLAIPEEPLAPVVAGWSELDARPFHLVHCDVHRKNMIVDGDRVVFLDWELALWGDPLYEVAVHLHKMGYQPDEGDRVVSGWLGAVPSDCSANWRRDLEIYRVFEFSRAVGLSLLRSVTAVGCVYALDVRRP